MRLAPRSLAIAAIAAGALGAAVLPSSADVSTESPSVAAVRVESPATLEARGAAVKVTVTIVCQPGAAGFVSIVITQNAGGGSIARGSDGRTISSCTGTFQPLEFHIPSDTVAFRKGVAFGSADFFISGTSATDDREIQIVRSPE